MTPGANGARQAFALRIARPEPGDLYRYMDYVREHWDERNVYVNAKRVGRLRQLCERLPDRYYQRCRPHLKTLIHRIDYPPERTAAAFLALGGIVSEWGRGRRTA